MQMNRRFYLISGVKKFSNRFSSLFWLYFLITVLSDVQIKKYGLEKALIFFSNRNLNSASVFVSVLGVMCEEGMCTSCTDCMTSLASVAQTCAGQHSQNYTGSYLTAVNQRLNDTIHQADCNSAPFLPMIINVTKVLGLNSSDVKSFQNFYSFVNRSFLQPCDQLICISTLWAVKKTRHFYFFVNSDKYWPIFISFSLLYTTMNCGIRTC